MNMPLFVLWLFSAVYWGNHGADISPGWYNHWAGYDAGVCAAEGVAAVRDERAIAFACQPASFPRPQPVAQPIERE